MHFGVRVARFEAHGLRFGGYRALTSLSAVASAAARAVQVPAHRAWHPPPSHGAPQRVHEEDGSCRRHGDVASTAGVRTELRTTGFTAAVRWVVGARELRPPSERTLKGNEAHGRTEPGHVGNDAAGPRTRRRSKALKPTQPSSLHTSFLLATGWSGRGRPAARQRQEGNDRGDAERLSTGNILRGVRVALRGSRNGSRPALTGGASGPCEQETQRTS